MKKHIIFIGFYCLGLFAFGQNFTGGEGDGFSMAKTSVTLGACTNADNLESQNVGKYSAEISWNGTIGSTQYKIRYRISGSSIYKYKTTTDTWYKLQNLQAGTTYEWQVKNYCGGRAFEYGPAESFTTQAADCGHASNLYADFITKTSAHLHWTSHPSADSCTVRLTEYGSNSFRYKNTSADSIVIGGLSHGTTYSFQVKSRCSSEIKGYSDTLIFTTILDSCAYPVNLNASNITPTKVDLSWDGPVLAQNYTIRIAPVGTQSYNYHVTSQANTHFDNLQANTQYYWQVKTYCPSMIKYYCPADTFQTAISKEMENRLLDIQMILYPNPADDKLNVMVKTDYDSKAELSVFNFAGQVMYSSEVSLHDTINYLNINTEKWSPGIYYVRLRGENLLSRQKLIIQ